MFIPSLNQLIGDSIERKETLHRKDIILNRGKGRLSPHELHLNLSLVVMNEHDFVYHPDRPSVFVPGNEIIYT